MKNQVYHLVSILAIIAAFVPALLVVYKRKWKERALLFFALYWAFSGIINIISGIKGISISALELITVVYNMLDIPIALAVIYTGAESPGLKKFTAYTCPSFLLLQLINFMIKGWHYDAAKYVLGIGILLVLISAIWGISLYLQKLEHSGLEKAMVFIYASLLFAYGTFVIIYIFDYYIQTSNRKDNFLIYYISTLVAILIASVGYYVNANDKRYEEYEN